MSVRYTFKKIHDGIAEMAKLEDPTLFRRLFAKVTPVFANEQLCDEFMNQCKQQGDISGMREFKKACEAVRAWQENHSQARNGLKQAGERKSFAPSLAHPA